MGDVVRRKDHAPQDKNKLVACPSKSQDQLSKSVGLSANGDEEEIFAQLLAWAQVNGRQQDYQPRFNSKPINCCPGHPFACH
ncbi:hypothetical protein QQP08_003406 [Theobroma cacao]|nr:hypothetical protein QQP08_003406 [Theobroma cacao]